MIEGEGPLAVLPARNAGSPVVTHPYQPVPKPKTLGEYAAVRHLLTDTAGSPLVTITCTRCSSKFGTQVEHYEVEPHVDEIRCPTCSSTSTKCLRPSGHTSSQWHKSRFGELDAILEARLAEGLAVPALWAEHQ